MFPHTAYVKKQMWLCHIMVCGKVFDYSMCLHGRYVRCQGTLRPYLIRSRRKPWRSVTAYLRLSSQHDTAFMPDPSPYTIILVQLRAPEVSSWLILIPLSLPEAGIMVSWPNERSSDSKAPTDRYLPTKQDAQKSLTPLGELERCFPSRGSLCLHRLIKRANLVCNLCSLGKISKLVAYANDKWDGPLCKDYYSSIQSGKGPPI